MMLIKPAFLKAAHKQQRIAAVHIDLQPVFYAPETASAFTNTRHFAEAMRKSGIPNIWVTFPFHEPPISERICSVADYNKSKDLYAREGLSNIVGAQGDETVIIKTAVDGLQSDQVALETHLDTLGVSTLFVTGVLGAGCVATTMQSGIKANRWNIIAVQDCIDMQSPGEYADYMRLLASDFPGFNRRFGMTTSKYITNTVAPRAATPLGGLALGLGRVLGFGT